MRDLCLRVLLVVAAVALLGAFVVSLALATTESGAVSRSGELHLYGDR